LDACSGLLGKHVRQAGMARPSARLHANPPQDNQYATGGGKLGEYLDTGHVLPQRETRYVPRSNRQQSSTSSQRYRLCVVCHQVSYRHSVVTCSIPVVHSLVSCAEMTCKTSQMSARESARLCTQGASCSRVCTFMCAQFDFVSLFLVVWG